MCLPRRCEAEVAKNGLNQASLDFGRDAFQFLAGNILPALKMKCAVIAHSNEQAFFESAVQRYGYRFGAIALVGLHLHHFQDL